MPFIQPVSNIICIPVHFVFTRKSALFERASGETKGRMTGARESEPRHGPVFFSFVLFHKRTIFVLAFTSAIRYHFEKLLQLLFHFSGAIAWNISNQRKTRATELTYIQRFFVFVIPEHRTKIAHGRIIYIYWFKLGWLRLWFFFKTLLPSIRDSGHCLRT